MESLRAISGKIIGIMELIKFEHTIFALPFVMMALLMVYGGFPDAKKTAWIFVCMVSARSASMAFNRIVDYSYDKRNPRTKRRPLQSGKVRIKEAWAFTVAMIIIFMASSWALNYFALIMTIPVLLLLFCYSYTKRFGWYSHLLLGLSLGCGPMAVSVAVNEEVSLVSVLLAVGVTFWVAGFDILYATQDYEFDLREKLVSIPVKFGIKRGLIIARAFHAVTVVFFCLVGISGQMGFWYYAGIVFIGYFLFYEHRLIYKQGLSKINTAFFTVNGVISIVFFLFSAVDIFTRRG